MIERYVESVFHEPPRAMGFESRYASLLSEIQAAAQRCLDTTPGSPGFNTAATKLYIMVQAIPSVLLNYKISIEFGLPLHPTEYIDFHREEHDPEAYLPSTRRVAHELFLESIDLAQALYRLDPLCAIRLGGFRDRIPEFLTGFFYANAPDRYTWRASDPRLVTELARQIGDSDFRPDLVLAAAHGSIRPAIALANALGARLYFIRFSLFKRADEAPIIAASDEAFLERFRDKKVLLFDEDVAKGRTLRAFADTFGSRFAETRTASALRHYLAPFVPDFVGETFFDD